MKSIDRMLNLYRSLIRALPEDFRSRHGDDMVQATEDVVRHTATRRSPRGFRQVLVRVFADLLWRIPVEHAAAFRFDAAHGLRTLGRSPGFTLASVVSLGIGIGLAVSMFIQLEMMLFREVPGIQNPDTLVTLQSPVPYSYYDHFRERSDVFAEVGGYMSPVPFKFGVDGETQRLWGHIVTPNHFHVLGTATSIGRAFDTDESGLIISHRLWKSRFAEDPSIVGRTVRLNGHPVAVIGVAAEGFAGAAPFMAAADLWLPTTASPEIAPELTALHTTKDATLKILGRLRLEVSRSQAQAALDSIVRQLEGNPQDAEQKQRGRRVTVIDGGRLFPLPDDAKPVMFGVPFVIGALSLWIACSNVGTMLLARGGPRRKEMAIRISMGASRSRIIRQLITESLILASLGGIAGWLFAAWSNSTVDWLRPVLPGYVNFDLRLDWRAFLFTILIVGVSSILFGLAPALQAARGDVLPGLKSAGALWEGRRYRWFSSRNMLVLQQVAGSLMLVLLTGFVALGFQRSGKVDLGFSPDNIYTMTIDPMRDGYTLDSTIGLLSNLPERLKTLPGIEESAISHKSPVAFFSDRVALADGASMRIERVNSGFLETLGVPILRGRAFDAAEERSGASVAIVNEAMAARNWPGQEPIGKRFEIEEISYTVVGLTGNVRSSGVLEPSQPGALVPIDRDDIGRPSGSGVTVIVRTTPGLDPSAALRREIEAIDPALSVLRVQPLSDEIAQIMYMIRITTITYAGIGLFGLILAAVGLAGLTAYTVAQRTKEIGIRMALGARQYDVLRIVLKESAILVLVGTAIGHASAWAAMRGLGAFFDAMSSLTETTASDPLLIFGAPILLGALTMVSCYAPARRAIRIDPLVSLRQE